MPSKPLNLTVVGVNGTSIRLSWIAPEHSNGAIQGYWIYYVYQNETLFKPCLKNDAATGTKIFYNLTNLRKDIMTKTVIKTVITFKNSFLRSLHWVQDLRAGVHVEEQRQQLGHCRTANGHCGAESPGDR